MTNTNRNQLPNITPTKLSIPRLVTIGILVSLATLVITILLSCYFNFGKVSLEGIIYVQTNNKILWVMAGLPFLFAMWMQLSTLFLPKATEIMLADQTDKFMAHTEMLESKLDYTTSYDALTGLTNRGLFRKKLDQALIEAKTHGHGLAVMLLDLDHFKEINDTLGHDNGDLVLKRVAARLNREIEVEDILARMGGDEFALLIQSIDQDVDIRRLAGKLIEALGKPLPCAGISLDLRVSVGIAVFPEHGLDSEAMLMHADVAMYAAKDEGGGFKEYMPELDNYSPERLALMGELRQALIRNELFLHYQPKVNSNSGLINEGEALIRWAHPEQGLLPPGLFIPIAERSGLIKEISLWVLEAVIRQLAVWKMTGKKVKISVNLSTRDLLDKDLPKKLSGLLHKHGVSPNQLTIEITETVLITDPERALGTLHHFSRMGIDISIDDFGTGYSSLSYLKKMPAREIKIDRSFVMDMLNNNNDAAIVQSAIFLAHSLGMKVVAEGVENQEIADSLKELDCDILQGFHFSRPLAPEEFIAQISHNLKEIVR